MQHDAWRECSVLIQNKTLLRLEQTLVAKSWSAYLSMDGRILINEYKWIALLSGINVSQSVGFFGR